MAKHDLVIVESPAKAKTIGKYLGKDYEVKACMGHLRDLQKSNLSVDVDNDFEPVYKPIKGKEAIISDLKKSAKAADTVYLATDPDREGEAISWHLKSLLNLPDDKTKRVTFNEITKNVVRQSIESPRDIDQNLVDAQQARRILDAGRQPHRRQRREKAALFRPVSREERQKGGIEVRRRGGGSGGGDEKRRLHREVREADG